MADHPARTPRELLPWFTKRPRRRRRLGGRWPTAGQARRVLAVLLIAGAVVLALQPAGLAGEPMASMLVTARDVPAGSTLHSGDLRVVRVPRSVLPAGVLTHRGAAAGRVLAGAARRGEPVTDARLVGRSGGRLAGGPGTAAVPVRLADSAVAGLLQPGARVDVVTVDGDSDGGRVLASAATVVTVTDADDSQLGGRGRGRLVLLGLPARAATRVAAVSLNQPVTVTLR